jgi:hypothetical protein
MATVHDRDIMRWLAATGQPDALPWSSGYFFEIRFDEEPSRMSDEPSSMIYDEEFVNRVITVDAPQGNVTIIFDEQGLLKSLEIC